MDLRRMPDGWERRHSGVSSPGQGPVGNPVGRGAAAIANPQAEPRTPLPGTGVLILTPKPELAEAIWKALVETLGGVQEVKQSYRLVFPSPIDGLGAQLRRASPAWQVVLVDLQASRARLFLEDEGFALLGDCVYIGLAPNAPDFVLWNQHENRFELVQRWSAYVRRQGFADVVVHPDEWSALHIAMQSALERKRQAPSDPNQPAAHPPDEPVPTARPPESHPAAPWAPHGLVSQDGSGGVSVEDHWPPTGREVAASPAPLLLEPEPPESTPEIVNALPRWPGAVAIWSPFDRVGRTTLALELATAVAQILKRRIMVGEFRRPVGMLAQHLALDQEALGRSLFTLARQLEPRKLPAASAAALPTKQATFKLDLEQVSTLLPSSILLDRKHLAGSARLEFFHAGRPARQEEWYALEVLNSDEHPFLGELVRTIQEAMLFAALIIGSTPLDPLHFPALRLAERLLIVLPTDPAALRSAVEPIQAVLRLAQRNPANVDLCLTQWDRHLAVAELPEVLEALRLTGQLGEEKHQRRVLAALGLEREVLDLWKQCKLAPMLAGILPDEVPLLAALRKQADGLLPAMMQPAFAKHPYVCAIRQQLFPGYFDIQVSADLAPARNAKRSFLRR